MSAILPINNLNRVVLSEAVPLSTPFSVFVFPTTFCNFKCVYCAHSMSDREFEEHYKIKTEYMSLETYRVIIEQLKEFPKKLKLLSLTGQGEPLLNKNLPEMIALAKKAGVAERIEVISNGALLSKEYSDRLINSGLDGLRISLQGLSSEKYKEVCGVSIDFDRFIEQLDYFFRHKGNCDLFVKIMDAALQPGEEELFYKTFDKISDRMYIERCRPVYEGVAFTSRIDPSAMDRYGNAHEKRTVCPLCFYQLGIFPDGDVAPCDAIYKPVVLGNVHSDTLRNMFSGRKLRDFQIMHLNGRRFDDPKCAVCCAPDDVANEQDVLDADANNILKKMEASE